MIVVHTLKPSSLAHSLQIYCIGLTGLRSHAFWAWPEKRDPTIGAVCGESLCVSSAMANHGGIKLLPVGVHQEDRCGDGTNCTKASPLTS